MTVWPPVELETEILDWTIADIRHGDLIFCSRPGDWVAFADSVAGEQWRHVGSLSRDSSGDWAVLETFGDTFAHRKLADFLQTYDEFGVARLDVTSSCVERATAWMQNKVDSGTEHVYAWDDLIIAGLIAATHRHIQVSQREQLRSALAAAAAASKERPEHKRVASLTCSAFVQIAYENSGDGCAIVHDRWRSAATEWPPIFKSLDRLFDGPAERFEDVVGDTNLLELFSLHEVNQRSAAGSTAKPGQIREMLRLLLHAIAGWHADEDAMLASIGSDGRWVTPGDLWISPSVRDRGALSRPEALAQLALES